MIKAEIIRNEADTDNLCKTYSNDGFKLRQVETGLIYGSTAIDVIIGYNEDGTPFGKYSYEETDEIDSMENEVIENGYD